MGLLDCKINEWHFLTFEIFSKIGQIQKGGFLRRASISKKFYITKYGWIIYLWMANFVLIIFYKRTIFSKCITFEILSYLLHLIWLYGIQQRTSSDIADVWFIEIETDFRYRERLFFSYFEAKFNQKYIMWNYEKRITMQEWKRYLNICCRPCRRISFCKNEFC